MKNKNIIIALLCLVIAVLLFIIIWNAIGQQDKESGSGSENEGAVLVESENSIDEISNFSDTPENEYINNNINNSTQKETEETQETDSSLGEEYTRYLIKSVDGYIFVYYLTDTNEEILYKETTISVEYLSQADMDDLEVGIEVTGIEEVNKMLEDFE